MPTDKLQEWARHLIIHKDIITKDITAITPHNNELTIKRKSSPQRALFPKKLQDITTTSTPKEHLLVFVYNTPAHFQELITHWKDLIPYLHLTIYFVNPTSTQETKWAIRPHLHDRICDKQSLKQGLQSMFSTVDTV